MIKRSIAIISLMLVWSNPAFGAGFEILVPHRAVYEVNLEQAENRSDIKSMSGRIVYEIKGNECEGLVIRFRFVTAISTSASQFLADQQTTTYESPDGNEFTFVTKSFVDENADRIVRGSARRKDGRLNVNLDSPQARDLTISDAIFTSAHLVEIIELARDGEVFLTRDVFDGSGNADKIVASASVIGKPRMIEGALKGEALKEFDHLKDQNAWPITISYFDKDTGRSSESLPVYEASFLLHENGVTRQLLMRYPDYTLKASLSGIEFFDNNPCQVKN